MAIKNHGKSLRHGSACCNPSNWGQGTREAARSRRVRVSNHGATNVSLERCLFELMKDKKYRTIHMSHVGSILQITSIRIKVFKVCLHINSNKRLLTTSSSTMNHGSTAICHSSEDGCFVTWTQAGHRFREDKLRMQIGLSISDISCCVMTCS